MIPNDIILTYKDENIPSYVIQNVKKLNPEKNIKFFTDKDVVSFLLLEYDSSYADFFRSLQRGCTKGDFFRYCYLLKYGGYYCDIDIEHSIPISQYVAHDVKFFSVTSAISPSIFQALLYCVREHEVIHNCINDMMKPETASHPFYRTTEDMYTNIQKYLEHDGLLSGGIYKKGNDHLQLAQEGAIGGRYVCVCNQKIIAFSRYQSYTRGIGFKT